MSEPPVSNEVPNEWIEAMLQDAAQRSGAPEADLEVVRAELVEWSDGSLGCPEPGQFYTQAIVPGYWVEIEGPDRLYDYRSDEKGHFILCDRPGGSPGTSPDR